MRIVVDYLAEEENYIPTEQKIVHTEALLRLLRALSDDDRYLEVWKKLTQEDKKEGNDMCKLLDKYWYGGVAQGKAESDVGTTRSMYSHKMTAETIAELINQNLAYIKEIIALFEQYPTEDDLSIAKRLIGNASQESQEVVCAGQEIAV